MINNKSIKRLVLILIISMIGVMTGNRNALATSRGDTNMALFMYTDQVRQEIKEMAEEKKQDVLESLPEIVDNWETYKDKTKQISYGSPFVLGDIVYFPVVCKKKLIATVGVVNDESRSWYVSQDLVKELNYLSQISSEEYPVNLFMNDGDIYGSIGKKTVRLTNYYDNSSKIIDLKSTYEKKRVENIFEEKETLDDGVNNGQHILKSRPKYLDTTISETQPSDNHWCTAYCGAMILSFMGVPTKAVRIMEWLHPDLVGYRNELKRRSLSDQQMIEYGNTKGFKSTKYYKRSFVLREVKNQIDLGSPMLIGGKRTINGEKHGHAFVLRGYDETKNMYSVWNPWNSYYSKMDISNGMIPAEGGAYSWTSTISNWFLS